MNKKVIIATAGLTSVAVLTAYILYKRQDFWNSNAKQRLEKMLDYSKEIKLLGENVDYEKFYLALGYSEE